MNANEKIFISNAWFVSNEDDYENGEKLNGSGSSWDGHDIGLNYQKGYDSVEDALRDVCDKNCFAFRKENWETNTLGDNPGRCESGFMVDVNNSEATQNEIEEWKQSKTRLWYCSATIFLEVRSIRQLTEDEVKLR